jgi:hypothetical protein
MCVFLTLWLFVTAFAGVVDRIVVVVDEELVLESDIRLEAVITGLDVAPLPFWTRAHATPVERLEKAAMVRSLAAGVALYEPDPADVAARVRAIRARLGGPEAWAAFEQLWGLDDRSVARLVRRRMVVERYLARNLTEDPSRPDAWLTACDALLDELRPRFRIRQIPPRATP